MENEFSLFKCLADKRGLLLGGYFNEEFVKKKIYSPSNRNYIRYCRY